MCVCVCGCWRWKAEAWWQCVDASRSEGRHESRNALHNPPYTHTHTHTHTDTHRDTHTQASCVFSSQVRAFAMAWAEPLGIISKFTLVFFFLPQTYRFLSPVLL